MQHEVGGQGVMSDRPIFVLGAQRSGTTMLRLMLNQHPRLAVPHEPKFIMWFYPKLPRYGDLSRAENAARLLGDIEALPAVKEGGIIVNKKAILRRRINTYSDLADSILTEFASSQGKKRWVDKTPFYTPDIDILWKLFPECQIIHLVRDGRDVLVSQRRLSWGSNSVPRLAEDWRWKTTICHKVGSVLGPEHFLELKYEDLLVDPEANLRRVCRFLREEYSPSMLEYHRVAEASVPTKSMQWHKSSVGAPDRSKLYAWKRNLSLSDRAIFEEIAGSALDLFGYEREYHRPSLRVKLRKVYFLLIKRW